MIAIESPAGAEIASRDLGPKRLFRLVEDSYADLAAAGPEMFYRSAIERTRERFGAECGIEAALLLRRDGLGWNSVAGDDPALARCVERLDEEARRRLDADRVAFPVSPFPASVWLLGGRREWLAVFRLARPRDEDAALLLQMARLVVQHRALETGWSGIVDQAREIQRSLLPDPLPALDGFDLAVRSEAAQDVGGDVYDAIRLAPDAIGLMIADASGHGLPAALEARDVVVGLRMGASWYLKIDATIERLNRVLCASRLSSRFVSLVFGELDETGSFDYINAGHPPPLIVAPGGNRRLASSGRVLGVSPDSVYRLEHAEIPSGGTLLLYTDGVTECPSPSGEEFGIERLAGIASVLARSGAAHVCSAVFEALAEHAAGMPFPDDASVLVVRRLS